MSLVIKMEMKFVIKIKIMGRQRDGGKSQGVGGGTDAGDVMSQG